VIGSNFTGSAVHDWGSRRLAEQYAAASAALQSTRPTCLCRYGTESATLKRTNLCDPRRFRERMFIWNLHRG
jgi:hypothetical protein